MLLGGFGLLLDFVYCVGHFGEWPPFPLVVPGTLVGLAAGLAYQGYLSIRRWHRPFLWKDEAQEPVFWKEARMRRLVFCCISAFVGFLIGWLCAICWAAATNNLMMPQPVYEAKRASILFTVWLIVGACTIVGGLLGLLLTQRHR